MQKHFRHFIISLFLLLLFHFVLIFSSFPSAIFSFILPIASTIDDDLTISLLLNRCLHYIFQVAAAMCGANIPLGDISMPTLSVPPNPLGMEVRSIPKVSTSKTVNKSDKTKDNDAFLNRLKDVSTVTFSILLVHLSEQSN